MISVNPNILVWARKTAGLTLSEAAAKINVVEHNLEKIEKGEKKPSHAILLKMADKYRRPLLTFYLENIPIKSNYGADFRGLSEQITPEDKALIDALLRYAQASQQMIRATLELEEESTPLSFVGWLRRKWGLSEKTDSMENELKRIMQSQQRNTLVADALHGINMVLGDRCNLNKYYEQSNPLSAFKLLRSSCEHSGIFVILKGNLGSSHSNLSPEIFRAFVIADNIAPFMVINNHDSIPAQSFSVLHEIIHLLLDQTGISDLQKANPIEKFCNHVAGEWLLPSKLIRDGQVGRQEEISALKEIISEISEQRNLSKTMVAMRLYQERIMSHESFSQLQKHYKQEWEKSRQRKQARKKTGGPSFYRVKRSQLGDGLLQFVKRMIQSENLTVSKAAIILSVKSGQVYKLLDT